MVRRASHGAAERVSRALVGAAAGGAVGGGGGPHAAARLGPDERGRRWLQGALHGALIVLLGLAALGAQGVALPRALVPLPATRAPVAFPLANPNHAAAMLAMLLPLALTQAVRSRG